VARASLQTVSREIADSLGLDRPTGALITDLSAGGPAAEAGLRRGDLISAIDGQSIDDPEVSATGWQRNSSAARRP